jgi:hypothetical protein
MILIATDLDRTLFPNGNQEYDNSMHLFCKILKNEKLSLAFVTGRNIDLVKQGIEEFHAPLPENIIAEVGTKIYEKDRNSFIEDEDWIKSISSSTKGWNIGNFKDEIALQKGMRMQEEEKYNQFKLSYYLDDPKASSNIVKEATKIVSSICKDALVVYSVDETHNVGLLDILPKFATKLTALEYLRKKKGLEKEDIIYCGDSGNDILPLTFGYKSILVRNAIDDVKNTVEQLSMQKNIIDKLYIAKGLDKLNGYYVSGIIEGLIKHNIIPDKYSLEDH